jgi:hypothetical protein
MKCPKCGHEFIPTSGRPRSTGRYSQNHRLNGFIAQICRAKNLDFDEVKVQVKYDAIELGFPPYEEVITKDGHRLGIFKSEAECTVEECGYLIVAVEKYAAEKGVTLREE